MNAASWKICPCCVMTWHGPDEMPGHLDPITDAELCSTCARHLARTDYVSFEWLEVCRLARASLRRGAERGTLPRSHPWWDLHDIGGDWDEMQLEKERRDRHQMEKG